MIGADEGQDARTQQENHRVNAPTVARANATAPGTPGSPADPISMQMEYAKHENRSETSAEMNGMENPHTGLQGQYVGFIQKLRCDPTDTPDEMRTPSFTRELVAEFIGCFLLILYGCGINATATLFAAQSGLFQVSVIWGFAVLLAIWTTGSISGAHINPSVSLSLMLLKPEDFPAWKLLPYWFAQLLGCFAGAAMVYLLMGTSIETFEYTNGIIRGEENSDWSASIFGMYYPNPGYRNTEGLGWGYTHVTMAGSLGCEILGTAVLMFSVLALNDPRNQLRLGPAAAAFGVSMVIILNVAIFGAINQAGYNPARDLGPRLVAACAGWGDIAFPGPQNGFWVYTIGPLIGAPLGGAVHEFILMRGL
ncbi:Aquaporin-9 [Hondaea fermentalgiana]|uniref:Aquaporin-9 n=1 Tax=Hondaea fermentalgiana TaxID=2315210 RepID=A0A2R5FZU2_9STRA|nr:Aquaporin-9 [Hondaea fermentalgiana]|eukprot:GBG24282.1 Aquaporin-9 [Hondaea fermentalgiana]